MTDPSLEVVRRYLDCVNSHDWDGVAQVTTESLSSAVREGLWRAFPDLRIDAEWMDPHGDKVSAWCYGTGTHLAPWQLPPSAGSFAGRTLAPTGNRWRAACAVTYRVRNGRIADVWGVWDWLGLLGQLGVVAIDCA
jgi:predicted ester cyclase